MICTCPRASCVWGETSASVPTSSLPWHAVLFFPLTILSPNSPVSPMTVMQTEVCRFNYRQGQISLPYRIGIYFSRDKSHGASSFSVQKGCSRIFGNLPAFCQVTSQSSVYLRGKTTLCLFIFFSLAAENLFATLGMCFPPGEGQRLHPQ